MLSTFGDSPRAQIASKANRGTLQWAGCRPAGIATQSAAARGHFGRQIPFLFQHVQSCCGDGTCLQCVQQGGVVDERTPCRVDQYHARFHAREGLAIEKVVRGLRGRNMKAQNIAALQDLLPRHHADAGDGCCRDVERWGEGLVVRENFHAEAQGDTGHVAPDPAQPDDAQRLSFQLEAGEAAVSERTLARPLVGLCQMASHAQQQREGMFGDAGGPIVRHVAHGNAASAASLQVDVIEARGARCHEPHARQQPEHRFVNARAHEDAQHLGVFIADIGYHQAFVLDEVRVPVGRKPLLQRGLVRRCDVGEQNGQTVLCGHEPSSITRCRDRMQNAAMKCPVLVPCASSACANTVGSRPATASRMVSNPSSN